MGEKILNVIVDGGKATAGPPLGPGLAPLGVNVGQVVAKINEETKAFAGLKIPVSVSVDTVAKSFKITVGSPAAGELIKQAAGIDKGSGSKDAKAGDLTMQDVAELAVKLKAKSQGRSRKTTALELVGTCVSMGVTIDGKAAKDVAKEIRDGKHDSILA
jgi:large subunit ribosomal protein L11